MKYFEQFRSERGNVANKAFFGRENHCFNSLCDMVNNFSIDSLARYHSFSDWDGRRVEKLFTENRIYLTREQTFSTGYFSSFLLYVFWTSLSQRLSFLFFPVSFEWSSELWVCVCVVYFSFFCFFARKSSAFSVWHEDVLFITYRKKIRKNVIKNWSYSEESMRMRNIEERLPVLPCERVSSAISGPNENGLRI